MNPQAVFHAYAMTYHELREARLDGNPVPGSVLARLRSRDVHAVRAAMRALRDVERVRPMRSKGDLLALLQRSAAGTRRTSVRWRALTIR